MFHPYYRPHRFYSYLFSKDNTFLYVLSLVVCSHESRLRCFDEMTTVTMVPKRGVTVGWRSICPREGVQGVIQLSGRKVSSVLRRGRLGF